MKSTSFVRDLRSTNARSNTIRQRGQSVPNSSFAIQSVDQPSQPKQEEIQEQISFRERLTRCIPNSPNTFMFFLFVVTYLICAIIRFAHTGDVGMFTTLLPYTGVYVGIPLVTPHIPLGKKVKNDRED